VANLVDGIYRPEGPSAASYLCNDMDDDSTAFTLACRVAESVRLLAEPVDLTATRSVPCTYVRLTLDATLPLGAQDRAAAALGDPDVVDLAAGHMAMISAPGALARIIEGAARLFDPVGRLVHFDGDGVLGQLPRPGVRGPRAPGDLDRIDARVADVVEQEQVGVNGVAAGVAGAQRLVDAYLHGSAPGRRRPLEWHRLQGGDEHPDAKPQVGFGAMA